ncbi:hypothetical protein SAMN04489712_12566 [Thermomonospora echinospora]|uniref:Uncharacterized protein n=1 Tax=Thermomonospora echinospora TaxID=1992 RepID=A0A1H6DXZ1_9ACTN|nr:hypothetical protein [Thermomonospora echinospora]SEG90197.1 hypothetical protein SAMN04489712_12566 [Thermomonospora echinospora]
MRKPAVLAPLLLGGMLTADCHSDGTAAGKPSAASALTAEPTAVPSAVPNGVERLTAQEILDRARETSLAVGSVRMRGEFV